MDQMIKNLQRENAMISTAWYDLTGRLQSNHVVLQRRQELPKSWLNKQRQMVNCESNLNTRVLHPFR
jgi:protein HOOK3